MHILSQIVYAQPRICPRKQDEQNYLRFWDTNGSSNLVQTTRPSDSQQKKKNRPNSRLCHSGWSREKLKESEKRDKYWDLARELKNLWNMKVTMIPIVISAFCTVTIKLVERLEDLEIRGWVEIIQTIALLKTARILRRVLETCYHANFSEIPSANAIVSRNLLGILVYLNNTILWMIPIRPPISNSSSPLSKPLGTISSTPVTIGIIVTFIAYYYYYYYYLLLESFSHQHWLRGTRHSLNSRTEASHSDTVFLYAKHSMSFFLHVIDPQSLPSSTIKIKSACYLFSTGAIWRIRSGKLYSCSCLTWLAD